MIIVGITGTLGAGKGAIVEYLKQKGFVHYSSRDFIVREIKKRNLPVNRDTMTVVANDLRAKHGPSFIAEENYKEALKKGDNAVIESLRAVGEEEALRKKGSFVLLAVDASPQIRYDRIYNRGSETDKITFEKFLADEEREMNSLDSTKQNIKAVMDRADITVQNDGTLEDLHRELDKVLGKFV